MTESAPQSKCFPDESWLRPDDAAANPAQKAAIHHVQGPCEVLAGPGSGKTFVIVQRILYLIRCCGISPSHILVLTFSRAAAAQMRQRYRTLQAVQQEASPEGIPASGQNAPSSVSSAASDSAGTGDVTFGTFHSVFYRMYRISSGRNPSVITSRQTAELLSHLIRRHLHRPPVSGEAFDAACMISRAKSSGRFPVEGDPASIENFRQIYADYSAFLKDHDLIDYEDMISLCAQLLRAQPEELHRWQEQFPYILVDEYQDINAGQSDILSMLAGERRNLFVVGDDDQSIYGFRGSDPSFMREFAQRYPDAKHVQLDVNYRSRPQIVHASLKVIRVNQNRMEKQIRSAWGAAQEREIAGAGPEAGSGVFLHEYVDTAEQFQWLCGELSGMSPDRQSASAVILRTHIQMEPLIRRMDQLGIPFQGTAAENARMRRDATAAQALQTVTGYYRLAEEISAGRIFRETIFLVMNRPERYLLRRDFRRSVYTPEELEKVYPTGSREWDELRTLCRDAAMLGKLTPNMSLRYLRRVVGFQSGSSRLDAALDALAGECADARAFLGALRESDFPVTAEEGKDGAVAERGVRLLTMHGAKGLEFDTVFLPDLNEGLLPGRRSRSPEAIEEERRLFYVAMTRARGTLHLMYLRGTKRNPRLPSRFLHPLGVKDWI